MGWRWILEWQRRSDRSRSSLLGFLCGRRWRIRAVLVARQTAVRLRILAWALEERMAFRRGRHCRLSTCRLRGAGARQYSYTKTKSLPIMHSAPKVDKKRKANYQTCHHHHHQRNKPSTDTTPKIATPPYRPARISSSYYQRSYSQIHRESRRVWPSLSHKVIKQNYHRVNLKAMKTKAILNQ